MPWGSWITCEETINGPDVGPDFQGRTEHRPRAEARLHLRGAGQATARATASRSPGPGASRTRPCRSTRSTGSCTSPRTTSSSPPASTATSRRTTRWRPGTSTTRAQLQMLAVTGQPNAHLEARQPQRATYGVRWVDIDDPDPTMAPGTTNDQALVKVGDQGRAQGAALFSRLEGQVYDNNVVYFTSTQGGGDAEQDWGARDGRRRRQHQRLRQGQRPGLGLPLPLPDAAGPLPGAGRRRGGEPHASTSPTTSPPVPTARSSSARTARSTTTSAACPAVVSCGTSPSTGWSARSPPGRTVRRGSATSSPARRSPPTATPCSSTSRPAAA